MAWGRRDKVLTDPPDFGTLLQTDPSIRTGERLSLAICGVVLAPDEYLRRLYPTIGIPSISERVWTARPLAARVNAGIWIASCDCGGRGIPSPGGVVFVDTPFVFCLRCGNGSTGRGWRPVTVPNASRRDQIERVLMCRPNVSDQNWEPTESIDELLRQNIEHGDAVPEVTNGLRNPD